MVSRLMDLVLLVTELSEKHGKSFKDMDKELLHHGYSAEEVEEAFKWIRSRWRPPSRSIAPRPDTAVFRILSPWESLCLDSEAHGYLLRLRNLGILDDDQFEQILKSLHPFGVEPVQLIDAKVLAGRVVFSLDSEEIDDELFDAMDDETAVT